MIRKATVNDASAIAIIYNHYILNSTFTFEEEVVDESIIIKRLCANEKHQWWVYEEDGKILGYAYPSIWKARTAYRFTVESSLYINLDNQKRGIGTKLYNKLIQALKKEGFHVILAGISLPNDISIFFHEKIGFKKVAHLKDVGFKFEKWIDIGYWELKI